MSEFTSFELLLYASVLGVSAVSVFFVKKGLSFREKALNASAIPDHQVKSNLSKNLKNEVVDFISNILEASPDLSSSFLSPSDKLTRTASEIGLSNIEYMITEINSIYGKVPYILGINKGGGFLASYFAHRLNLHEKQIIKCDYRTDHKKIRCESRPIIDGPLIILDDVVRTGSTITAVKKHLSKKYPGTATFTFSLVINDEILKNRSKAFLVNYAPWVSENREISLPWGRETKGSFKREKYFDDIEMDQIKGRLVRLDNLTNKVRSCEERATI